MRKLLKQLKAVQKKMKPVNNTLYNNVDIPVEIEDRIIYINRLLREAIEYLENNS